MKDSSGLPRIAPSRPGGNDEPLSIDVRDDDANVAQNELRIRFVRPAADGQRVRRLPAGLHPASDSPQDRWRWLPPDNWIVISEFLDNRSMVRLLQHSSTWLNRVVDEDPGLRDLLCDMPLLTGQLPPMGDRAAATGRDVAHYRDSVKWGGGVNEAVRMRVGLTTFVAGFGGLFHRVVNRQAEIAHELVAVAPAIGGVIAGQGCGLLFRRWERFALRRATARLATQAEQLRNGQRALVDRVFDAALLSPRPEGQPARTLSWAIASGESALVRAGMRRLTQLAAHHLPPLDLARLVLGGNEPVLLQKYCESPMADLCEAELAHYEAITTYVAELLCTPGFRARHLAEPIGTTEESDSDSESDEEADNDARGLIDLALSPMPAEEGEFPDTTPRNPAVAAAILRGIQESHAPPSVKAKAMRALVGGRAIAGDLVDIVAGDCELHAAARAPEWAARMGRSLRIHAGRELRLAIEAGSTEYVRECTLEFAAMRKVLAASESHRWLAGMASFLDRMCREPMLEDPAAVHRTFRGVMAFIRTVFESGKFTDDERLAILRGARFPLAAQMLGRNRAVAAAVVRGIQTADVAAPLKQRALAVAFGKDGHIEDAVDDLARECERRLATIDPAWAPILAAELREHAHSWPG